MYIHALLTCYMYMFDYSRHNIRTVIYFQKQLRRSVRWSNMRQPQRPSRRADGVGFTWTEFVAYNLDAEAAGATKACHLQE